MVERVDAGADAVRAPYLLAANLIIGAIALGPLR